MNDNQRLTRALIKYGKFPLEEFLKNKAINTFLQNDFEEYDKAVPIDELMTVGGEYEDLYNILKRYNYKPDTDFEAIIAKQILAIASNINDFNLDFERDIFKTNIKGFIKQRIKDYLVKLTYNDTNNMLEEILEEGQVTVTVHDTDVKLLFQELRKNLLEQLFRKTRKEKDVDKLIEIINKKRE